MFRYFTSNFPLVSLTSDIFLLLLPSLTEHYTNAYTQITQPNNSNEHAVHSNNVSSGNLQVIDYLSQPLVSTNSVTA